MKENLNPRTHQQSKPEGPARLFRGATSAGDGVPFVE
jgi:hypothetical protein